MDRPALVKTFSYKPIVHFKSFCNSSDIHFQLADRLFIYTVYSI